MKAFTLTELLVVVAIIAVLYALLSPVLTGARENANRASAISNMRQCIVAVNQYREQFDRFPLLALRASDWLSVGVWRQVVSYTLPFVLNGAVLRGWQRLTESAEE